MIYTETKRTRPLEVLDVMLSQGPPFGDSDYIHGQVQTAFRRRLLKVSASLPSAGDLVDALDGTDPYTRYRTYIDPVVRCAVQHSMRQLVTNAPYGLPLTECAEVFHETVRHLESGSRGGPLESSVPALDRLGPGELHGCVWSDDGSDNVFRRTFKYLVQENFGDPVGSPNQAGLDALRRGRELLEEILPSVSGSALSHAYIIALFPSTGRWGNMASASEYLLSGTAFLQCSRLDDPWWVAEHLLHESLHHKLDDIRHAHLLLAQDSRSEEVVTEEADQRIESIWNVSRESNPNRWGISRSLAAFHVYAHLALFALLADERAAELEASYGPRSALPLALIDSRTAFERARYLASAIKQSLWQELGLAGKCLIEWLTGFLDELEPAPSRSILHADLKLQRYRRESIRIESLLQQMPDTDECRSSGSAASLNSIIVDELATTRRILKALDAESALAELNDRIRGIGDDPDFRDFSRAREYIADALSRSVSSRCERPESQDLSLIEASELVETMIDGSSERLQALLAEPSSAGSSVQGIGIGGIRLTEDFDDIHGN
jgi:hypothetical protein